MVEPAPVMSSPRDSGGEETELMKTDNRVRLDSEDYSAGLPDNITGQSEVTIRNRDGTQQSHFGTKFDLDESAYGAAAVALVRDTTNLIIQYRDGKPSGLTYTRLATSLGVMVFNLVLQCLLLLFIQEFVVEPSVHKVQVLYRNFRTEVFDNDGTFLPSAWEEFDDKREVCQITMANRTFYYVIMCLWSCVCLQEVRTVHRTVKNFNKLEVCHEALDMVHYVDTKDPLLGGTCLITALTTSMRLLLLFFVCLPRFVISIYLFLLGMDWLSASTSFSDMVLNSIALGFVKDIDELLYASILPVQFQKQIADTDMFFKEKQKNRQDVDRDEWAAFNRTVAFVIGFALFVTFYGFAFQKILPVDLSQLQEICTAYMREHHKPICDEWGFMGWSEKCYPYGKSNAMEMTLES